MKKYYTLSDLHEQQDQRKREKILIENKIIKDMIKKQENYNNMRKSDNLEREASKTLPLTIWGARDEPI